jgi:hypothetical protein
LAQSARDDRLPREWRRSFHVLNHRGPEEDTHTERAAVVKECSRNYGLAGGCPSASSRRNSCSMACTWAGSLATGYHGTSHSTAIGPFAR